MQSVVLQVGKDPTLLATRAAVLQSARARVINASNASSWLNRIRLSRYQALLVCHSLNSFERAIVVAHARRVRPSAPLLFVSPDEECPSGFDAVLPIEPRALVAEFCHSLNLIPLVPAHPIATLCPPETNIRPPCPL